MITLEFLQSCTDEQINKGVAWLSAKKMPLITRKYVAIRVYRDGAIFIEDGRYFHPCQVPNDAWPIITTERIGNKPRGVDSAWYAYSGKFEVINENPLRAAMEVYILMSVNK